MHIGRRRFSLGIVFLVVDDGGVALANHLLWGFAAMPVLASAFARHSLLVEAKQNPNFNQIRAANAVFAFFGEGKILNLSSSKCLPLMSYE
jgi:hypothetical protein